MKKEREENETVEGKEEEEIEQQEVQCAHRRHVTSKSIFRIIANCFK